MSDTVDLISKVTKLRMAGPYNSAIRTIIRKSPSGDQIAEFAKNSDSDEYADIRLIVGTWEKIAILFKSKSEVDRDDLFRVTPVGLLWKMFLPAITIIREDGAFPGNDKPSPDYACDFEYLALEYDIWARKTDNGKYTCPSEQAIQALFG